jgi:hypothetical protein
MGVTVDAFQVAPLAHVPNHHRLFVLRKLQEVGRKPPRPAPVAQRIGRLHRAAVQFRYPDHKKSKIFNRRDRRGRRERKEGIMEERNVGMMKKKKKCLNPLFHHSIIPIFQISDIPSF